MREVPCTCTFNWVMGLVMSAQQHGMLRFRDIAGLLAEDMHPRKLWHQTRAHPAWSVKTTGIKLLFALITPQYYVLLLLKLFTDALNFAAPLILGQLVHCIASAPSTPQHAAPEDAGSGIADRIAAFWSAAQSEHHVQRSGVLAGVLFTVAVLKAVLDAQYSYHVNRMSIGAAGIIMQAPLALYLRKPAFVREQFSAGHLQTLVSVDARQVPNFFVSTHALISLPLQLLATLVVLWWQVQAAFVAGLLPVIALIPVNRLLSCTISTASQRMMGHKDRRLDVMSTLLHNLRSLFMLGWQQEIHKQALHHRDLELRQLAVRKYVDAVCVCTWALTPSIFAASTFGLMAWYGQPLSPATVIVCLSLFGIIIHPLNSLPWVLNGVIEAWVSADRLAKFLSSQNDDDDIVGSGGGCIPGHHRRASTHTPNALLLTEESSADSVGGAKDKKGVGAAEAFASVNSDSGIGLKEAKHASVDTAVQMRGACFSWSAAPAQASADARVQDCTLSNLSFSIPKGSCCVLTGSSGSGKSSLLAAILGDMSHVGGAFDVCGSIALAPQKPWLIADTIQANIVMGRPMSERRYEAVLDACELLPDIRAMPNGDATLVSDCGDNLSGGQQARVSLARTLYSTADVYLLDAVLAPLDGAVAASVLRSILFSPLTSHSTIIFATQRQAVVESGDFVLHMEAGQIASVVGQPGRHGTVMQRPAVHPSLTHVRYGRSSNSFKRPASPGVENSRSAVHHQRGLDDLWAACSKLKAGSRCEGEGEGEGTGTFSMLGNVGTLTLDAQMSKEDKAPQSSCSSPVDFMSPHAVQGDPFSVDLPPSAHAWLEHAEAGHLLEQSQRQSSAGNYGFFSSFQVTPALQHASTNLEDRGTGVNLPSPTGLASSNVSPAHAHHRRASGAWPAYASEGEATACHHRRRSTSDSLSLGGTASPNRANNWANASHPFMGFPQAFMKPTGSGSNLSELPLSSRAAGESNTPRLMNGVDTASRQEGVGGGGSLHQSDSRVALQAFFDSEALDAEETSQHGHVKLCVYMKLLSAVGCPLAAVTLCSLILMQALKTLTDVYVTLWSGPQRTSQLSDALDSQEVQQAADLGYMEQHQWTPDSTQQFLLGLALLTAGLIVITCARAFLYAFAGLRASKGLHQQLVSSILKADLSLLSRVPHGRVYARLSSDTETLDDSLPFIANILLASTAGFCAALIVMVVCQPVLLVLLVPLAAFYLHVQRTYRVGARELRRLESTSIAPVHQFFSEGVTGAHVIRSLDLVPYIETRMCEAVSTNMSARVANNAMDAWLSVRLQISSALLVGGLACSAVTFHYLDSTGSVKTPAWAVLLTGLGLAYALPMVSLLSSMLTASAKVEQDMVSVERTLQFINIPPARAGVVLDEPSCNEAQCTQGDATLAFRNVSLTYPGRRVPALDRVSFVLPAGKHVGICGRTGAGKSSLLNALFQLSTIQEGSIRIGRLDITELPARQLRQVIAVVPQRPVLLCGTVAQNLDPFQQRTPNDLVDVLRDLGLLDVLHECCNEQAKQRGPVAPQPSLDAEPAVTAPLLQRAHQRTGREEGGESMRMHSGCESDARHAVLGVEMGAAGVCLSAAQQQLLCLARALVQQPSVMCLDEVSAHLSTAEQAVLESVIARRLKGVTTVRVTHDRGCLQSCHYIGILSTGVMHFGPVEDMRAQLMRSSDLELIGS